MYVRVMTLAAVASAALCTLVQLPFQQRNSPTPQKFLIETMGGGVAVLDYDNDGRLDIFLVNSGKIPAPAAPRFDRANPQYWNRLFHQNADGSFSDVTETAGLAQAGDGNYGMGAAAADFNNDGFTDLYVTNYGHNQLYRNNGNGTFSDVTAQAGVGGGGWSVSAGFFDYDNDGLLDLFVTRYMEWDFAHNKVCARQTYCPPGAFPATTSLLFHNLGNGKFQDVSASSGIAGSKGRALGVAFNDYDDDGRADIFVANDGMEQFLFHNDGAGKFTERGLDAGIALTDDGKPISGMGADFRDYDNDGKPDIVVTDLPRQGYALYRNDGSGAFSYRSRESGLMALSAGNSGWGFRLEDFDNDGWKDLLIAQGHVMDNVEEIDPLLRYRERPLLAWNRSGRFERGALPTAIPAMVGRGAAFGDLNGDGFPDAVIGALGGRPTVILTSTSKAHWLTLMLEGTRSNRDGIGAVVRVNGQTQYATSAGSYASASDKRVHFGLAQATAANVEIAWPSGQKQILQNVKADQILKVREPR